jgi:hypothetical protein
MTPGCGGRGLPSAVHQRGVVATLHARAGIATPGIVTVSLHVEVAANWSVCVFVCAGVVGRPVPHACSVADEQLPDQ